MGWKTVMKQQKLVEKMTIEEKAAILSGKTVWQTREIDRLSIPSIFLSDGPHGIRKQAGAGDHLGLNASLNATCFPTAATIANSWNQDLGEEIGQALGEEAASMDVNILLGPGLNIKRSPLCGRNFEYFSEDPYLSGPPGGDHDTLLRGDVPAALRPAGQHRRQIHVLRPVIGTGQKAVGAPAGDHVEEAPSEPVQLRRRQRCGAVGSGDGNRLRRGGLRRSDDRDRLRRFGSRCGRGSPSAGTQARQHHQSQQDRTKPFHGSSFLPDAHWFALRLYHTELSGQIHHEMMKNIYKPVTVRLKISGISCIVFTSRRLQTRRR